MSDWSQSGFSHFVQYLPRRQFVHELLASLTAENPLNANVLLYCVWFALTERGRLRRPEFKKLETILHPWHERIVIELQRLSQSLQQFRIMQQWVNEETDFANQLEQQMLGQALLSVKKSRRNHHQQLVDACHNLAIYYKVMRIPANGLIHQATLKILQLFFTDSSDQQISQAFDQALNAARLEDTGFTQLSLV